MNKVLISFLFSFFFATLGVANSICYQHVSSNKIPNGNFKKQEVTDFINQNRILPPQIVSHILNRVNLYSLRGEEMGNAILVHAFAHLGPQKSRQRDFLVQQFLKPIFDYYLKEFEAFALKIPPGVESRVPNQFGLSRLGFSADAYGFVKWNVQNSKKFIELMKTEFSKKEGFDLVAANRLLIQMTLIHSHLEGRSKMTLAEVKKASDDYFFAESMGHIFIPAIGEFDIPNIVAQWHLNATVNMLPKSLNKKTEVHGGDGLSALEGITHDHGHVVRWRKGVVAESLGIKKMDLKSSKELNAQEIKIKSAFDQVLLAHNKNPNPQIDPEVLSHIIFFFIHQPETLSLFLENPKDFSHYKKSYHLAILMHEYYFQNQNFYPMIKAKKEVFIQTSLYWIQLLANQM